MAPHCPICRGTEFEAFNGRPRAVCATCRSLERGRLQYLIMHHLQLPRAGSRILHLAPEKHLLEIFERSSGELYHPCDYDINQAKYAEIKHDLFEIDLCHDIFRFPSSAFDLVIHNHVLEHIRCSVADTLKEQKRIVAPGGYLMFSVPFGTAHTVEDLSDDLTAEQRLARFGQADHMRLFGKDDFPTLLGDIFGRDIRFDTRLWPDDVLDGYAIPSRRARRVTGVSSFVWRKPAPPPARADAEEAPAAG